MKTATLEELERRAREMVQAGEAVTITEDGKPAAMLVPIGSGSLSMEERRKRYAEASAEVARGLADKGITEEEIQRDFEAWKRHRRQ